MAGRHKWTDLVAKMPPEQWERAQRKADELRKVRNVTPSAMPVREQIRAVRIVEAKREHFLNEWRKIHG